MKNDIHQQHIENSETFKDNFGHELWGDLVKTGASMKDIKSFHTTSTIKILEKIEDWGIGRRDNKIYGFPVIVSDNPNVGEEYKNGFTFGYNQALSDLLSHLSEAKELITQDN